MGRPIIQYPQDIVAIQEIIWQVKPDLIIETGIAHGGSLILSASLLSLLEICGEIEHGQVVGVDIDIRQHNRIEIEKHPLSKKIIMLEGSSISPEIISEVRKIANSKKRVMVFLDSNHTHKHVIEELNLYSPFVSKGSYLVVFDTIVEDLPEKLISDRPWGKGNNPKTAVWEFLKDNKDFEIDTNIDNKLLISVAPDGYLRKK
jgi:cephalosporin hydroxylase